MTRGTEADNDDMNAMNGDNDMKVDAPLNMSNADPLEDDADDALEEAAESERLAPLKAAMDYAVARLCEAYIDDLHNAPATGDPATASTTAAPTLTPAFRRLLADQVWNMAIRLSRDCEAFAKHAKRSTINVDDVLLFVRNTASVRERLAVGVERVKREKEKGKEKAGRKGKAKLEDKVEE